MSMFPFGGPSGLSTTDVASQIDMAIIADRATRAQTLRCRLRATSLAAFTASGSGVGKTLTKSSNGALGTIDSVTVVAGDRIFVDLGTANSGVYTATSVGAAGSPWVLTRTTDFDDANDVKSGTLVYVTEGTLYADTSWKLTTNDTITIDSTSQTWAAFTPNAYTDVTVNTLKISGAAGTILNSTGGIAADDTIYGPQLTVSANSPSQLTANTDNLATGNYGIIRLSSDAARNLTGIVKPSGTYTGAYTKISNVGSFTITLVNDATSTAANRFLTGTGANYDLIAGASIDAYYDATSQRWRLVGAVAASSLSDPQAIGAAKTGTWPDNSAYAYWSHKDVSATLSKYAVLQDSAGETHINSATGKNINLNIANSPIVQISGSLVQLAASKHIYDGSASTKLQSRPTVSIDNTVAEAGTTNVTVNEYGTVYRVVLNNSGVSRTAYTVAHNSGTPESGMVIEIICNTTIATITFTSGSTVVNATFSCVSGDVIRYYYAPSAWFGTKSKAA